MWRMYIKQGSHEDFIEFDSMEEAVRLADKMKRAYPWYTVKVMKNLEEAKKCG